MTFPTIHLNGTSAQELLAKYQEAAHAVNTAMTMLALSGPHGRDYYPQDQYRSVSAAITEARAEHVARMEKLRSVYTELLALVEHVGAAGAGHRQEVAERPMRLGPRQTFILKLLAVRHKRGEQNLGPDFDPRVLRSLERRGLVHSHGPGRRVTLTVEGLTAVEVLTSTPRPGTLAP